MTPMVVLRAALVCVRCPSVCNLVCAAVCVCVTVQGLTMWTQRMMAYTRTVGSGMCGTDMTMRRGGMRFEDSADERGRGGAGLLVMNLIG